jgi:hypothetical protein
MNGFVLIFQAIHNKGASHGAWGRVIVFMVVSNKISGVSITIMRDRAVS